MDFDLYKTKSLRRSSQEENRWCPQMYILICVCMKNIETLSCECIELSRITQPLQEQSAAETDFLGRRERESDRESNKAKQGSCICFKNIVSRFQPEV